MRHYEHLKTTRVQQFVYEQSSEAAVVKASIASLEPDRPIEYQQGDVAASIACLAQLAEEAPARDLGLSVRAWKPIKGVFMPRATSGEKNHAACVALIER